MIKVGTVFSGIGAPEQSLKNLKIDHDVLWACEIDRHAKDVYLANHKTNIFYDDITKIDITKLDYVDLFVFGFPCQDLSQIGLQDLSRGKSSLVSICLDIIDTIKPKYFLFENVKALSSKKFKDFRFHILHRLMRDYNIDYKILNSLNFGVAQNRERVFCVGIKKDINRSPSLPIYHVVRRTLKDFLDNDNEIPLEYFNVCPSMLKAISVGKSKILNLEKHAYCLTTKQDRSPNSGFIKSERGLRYLTANECQKLQGFPLEFKVNKSKNISWKLFGNSITVPVLDEIFKNLLETARQ